MRVIFIVLLFIFLLFFLWNAIKFVKIVVFYEPNLKGHLFFNLFERQLGMENGCFFKPFYFVCLEKHEIKDRKSFIREVSFLDKRNDVLFVVCPLGEEESKIISMMVRKKIVICPFVRDSSIFKRENLIQVATPYERLFLSVLDSIKEGEKIAVFYKQPSQKRAIFNVKSVVENPDLNQIWDFNRIFVLDDSFFEDPSFYGAISSFKGKIYGVEKRDINGFCFPYERALEESTFYECDYFGCQKDSKNQRGVSSFLEGTNFYELSLSAADLVKMAIEDSVEKGAPLEEKSVLAIMKTNLNLLHYGYFYVSKRGVQIVHSPVLMCVVK
jgi:hypothetical protein